MTFRIRKTVSSFALGLALATTALTPVAWAAGASDTEQERTARWQEIAKSIFGDRQIAQTDSLVKIEAPARALDAALVPITLTMLKDGQIKAVSLIIDDNPAPYAARFEFGPAADPAELKLRVRVNNYTDMHAVVETQDGKLYEAKQFVKASGGCSAPMGMSDEEAMKGMGDMRMKFAETQPGKPVEATLMVRHPNFSGMQMNQVTREYTPARYIDKLTVSAGDQTIFTLTGDISISSNPVINFAFKPDGKPIQVAASDNQGGRWQHSFNPPSPTN
ncbi:MULTISPECIES: quinoprotein dehydrogenase-associated SoxYZ-like carrier [unclassified Methylobacterium]|uniref:quinoprotein dehydrogenase-associated SoxYZ-like carrier n=1 Tax=unclassified Methylobacterium TaxID=2615210 RepID=UPI001FB9B516|nr:MULTISPECIES: quinoprotein dehydrogenase-associated SoxYZ-like carrier [unclassified Methylobacterium]MCJ2019889.1 quinoprotein dehydrogenase-associated SoxYZ-like carrier [Methylobacterium sp. E-065]